MKSLPFFTYCMLFCFSFFFLIPFSLALPSEVSSVYLLAAGERLDSGSIAKGLLTTTPGSGRVFIETNVLSNEDTQHSIRMARHFICSEFASCEDEDFFYSIQTNSPLITGPSGGAAFALLTFAHLHGLSIPNDISITGTINPGGFIGIVGGIRQKVIAASQSNINTVFLPIGAQFSDSLNNDTNLSVNNSDSVSTSMSSLEAFGERLGVRVVFVGSFDDLLYEVFSIPIPEFNSSVPSFYTELMSEVSSGICERALVSFEDVLQINSSYNRSSFDRFMNNKNIALNNSRFYSAASFCFGANVLLREELFRNAPFNASKDQVVLVLETARNNQVTEFRTLNDIQIYAVVQDRILDAQRALDEAILLENTNRLAYAYERARTALSWQIFYKASAYSFPFNGDMSTLASACQMGIQDARHRIQYVQFFLPLEIQAEQTLSNAEEMKSLEDFPLCIFYSLQAKAQADTISSVFGTSSRDISFLLDVKERIAQRYISRQYEKGNFPIIGFSYLEYANSLRDQDPFSALLYFQLAQELSAVDLFLDQERVHFTLDFPSLQFNKTDFILIGVVIGLLFSLVISRFFKK